MSYISYTKKSKCCICGKEFLPSTNYIYKKRNNKTNKMDWCCSYSCYNKLKEQREQEKRYSKSSGY